MLSGEYNLETVLSESNGYSKECFTRKARTSPRTKLLSERNLIAGDSELIILSAKRFRESSFLANCLSSVEENLACPYMTIEKQTKTMGMTMDFNGGCKNMC